MSEKVNLRIRLDFAQRARAYELEDDVGTDESATASEIIFLRDEVHRINNELTSVTLERDALKRELAVHKRCTFGGDYGMCELEAGHDGRHSLRLPSKSSVEGQS
jgi:hypothetical protein